KRSRSARGPPVCISSIPQQAKPNSRYQTDEARAQLRTSSTLVVTMLFGNCPFKVGNISRYPSYFAAALEGTPTKVALSGVAPCKRASGTTFLNHFRSPLIQT